MPLLLLSVSKVPVVKSNQRCGNKDCKVTNESPEYSCDGCKGHFHYDCLGHALKDIDRCLPCAKEVAELSSKEEFEEIQDDILRADKSPVIEKACDNKEIGKGGEII
jgi:hypothetical protein